MLPQGIELTTRVQLPSGESVMVYAFYALAPNQTETYRVVIQSKERQGFGYMTFRIKLAETDWLGKFTPAHICIIYMTATPGFKYGGTAMHEFAFRLSMSEGAKGHVRLEAVRNTHHFHVSNGFRLEHAVQADAISYYIALAKASIKADGQRVTENLNCAWLCLPPDQIAKKQAQFGITELADNTSLATPVPAQRYYADEIMQEAKQATLAIKALIGLKEPFGPLQSSETALATYTSFVDSRSVSCKKIRNILDQGCLFILEQLPIDNREKQHTFAVILTGTMMLAMLYHDLAYGKQALFNHKLLLPHIRLDDLLSRYGGEQNVIMRIGTDTLVHKTLAYDGKIRTDVFPELHAIPELQALLDSYQLQQPAHTVIGGSTTGLISVLGVTQAAPSMPADAAEPAAAAVSAAIPDVIELSSPASCLALRS